MTVKALFFGSIGVLAETSDIQRRAYNEAFDGAGLDWVWDEETYRYLLQFVGGQARLRLLSRATGTPLSSEAIVRLHQNKTQIAGQIVRDEVSSPRPGVAEAAAAARDAGLKLGIVTSTQLANIEAILTATGLSMDDFDLVVTQDDVSEGKPNPAPYTYALQQLGLDPSEALAIEDTSASVRSAVDAGLFTIAVPGAYATRQDFRLANTVAPSLLTKNGQLIAQLQALLNTREAA